MAFAHGIPQTRKKRRKPLKNKGLCKSMRLCDDSLPESLAERTGFELNSVTPDSTSISEFQAQGGNVESHAFGSEFGSLMRAWEHLPEEVRREVLERIRRALP